MHAIKERHDIKVYLYRLILILFTVLICFVSLTEASVFTVLKVRELGIFAFGYVDIYFLIRLIFEKNISGKVRIMQLIYACIVTVGYMMYCNDIFFVTVPGTTDDALHIAGILCILFMFTGKGNADLQR